MIVARLSPVMYRHYLITKKKKKKSCRQVACIQTIHFIAG